MPIIMSANVYHTQPAKSWASNKFGLMNRVMNRVHCSLCMDVVFDKDLDGGKERLNYNLSLQYI